MTGRKNIFADGIGQVFLAVILWGSLPVYWKQLTGISPDQILANRIICSFVFVFLILVGQKRLNYFRDVLRNEKKGIIFLSGLMITLNWFTYIYAVNTDHIIEASLGYYINPLLTILLGRIVLKEKMNVQQATALFFALTGVVVSTVSYGKLPVISLVLAFTFSIYSLLKKRVQFDVVTGLTLETMIVFPAAVCYLLILHFHGVKVYGGLTYSELLFLWGTGVITAIPLMLFAYGAKKVPLITMGFIQYLTPTLSLFIGVFFYHEEFRAVETVTFGLIWFALGIYTFSQLKTLSRQER
ncbi:RarD protein, DMT superfamily transporter [Syntrophobotulus glycolicus DSM 8271]|uniref:RarD protein, DMT superfamily transporter n=1 Tax=Syntrophobotulus glycolicus (strain DSM 8271 / FlGlyR) TaxID=645991 RepID=F0T044_SYNGF|nr:EamA family transporter RarD [Syntrophobotulus glycolicus]ADY56131.1 RarD protein, DMT superfamily transporter [Syntrophobotulus glycolicus DSM 8271]